MMDLHVFVSVPIRCMPIMGHSETDELSAAHVLYVCMQCADPLFLEVLSIYILYKALAFNCLRILGNQFLVAL